MTSIPRKKACSACRASRVRCDLEIPICSRCRHRGIGCVYPRRSRGGAPSRLSHVPIGPFGHGPSHSRLQDIGPATTNLPNSDDFLLDSGILFDAGNDATMSNAGSATTQSLQVFDHFGMFLGNIEPESRVNETVVRTCYASTSFLRMPSETQTIQEQHSQSELNSDESNNPLVTPSSNPTDDAPVTGNAEMPDADHVLLDALARSPTTSSVPNVLQQRSAQDLDLWMKANIIRGQITEYPKMMIEGGRLPPFIHPRYFSPIPDTSYYDNGGREYLPQPLAHCASLIHLHTTKTQASHDFVWRTIISEQNELCLEVRSFHADLSNCLHSGSITIL